jgi:pimeloyl-ACP methyl ester carboxylesterase
MPETHADLAPKRLKQWLDELRTPQRLRSYASLAEVAARLINNNPRLRADRAAWLAAHWTEQRADGQWHVLGDPAHKRVNPIIYRKDEVLEGWKRIAAPTLFIEGDETDPDRWWGHRYPRSEFEARIALVPDLQRARLAECGHMLHFDRPEALAERLDAFLA